MDSACSISWRRQTPVTRTRRRGTVYDPNPAAVAGCDGDGGRRRRAWPGPRPRSSGHSGGYATHRQPRLARRALGGVMGARRCIFLAPPLRTMCRARSSSWGTGRCGRSSASPRAVSRSGSASPTRLATNRSSSARPAWLCATTTKSSIRPQRAPLTFSGLPGVTIPANAIVLSDPVDLAVPNLTELAVSLYFPEATTGSTVHGLAFQTNYISIRWRLHEGSGPPD